MTTEQMDWLDDERAGRHTTDERRKAAAALGPIILYGTPSIEEMADARGRAGSRGVLVVPEELRDALIASGGGWMTPNDQVYDPFGLVSSEWMGNVTDQEEHTHRTREARDRCAAGDHEAAELYDKQADSLVHENEAHIREVYNLDESDMATMAEEPIEQRLRRAFVNGWREGFERGSWGDQRWDR